MFGLPRSTEFNKRIPKQKFYDNISVPPNVKRSFVEHIKVIYWRNKIASTTVNLAAGKNVTELEVFEIKLNFPYFDEAILREIDKQIPYHILYLMEYNGNYQMWICYKELSDSGSNVFKVDSYYHTDWLEADDIDLKLEGLDLDSVYENIVRQIAGDVLSQTDVGENIKESIERSQYIEKINKQISSLESKLRREKQLNRQMKINSEIKKLRREMDALYENKEDRTGKF